MKGRVRPVVCLFTLPVSRLQCSISMAAKPLAVAVEVEVVATCFMAYGGYGIAQLTVAVKISL